MGAGVAEETPSGRQERRGGWRGAPGRLGAAGTGEGVREVASRVLGEGTWRACGQPGVCLGSSLCRWEGAWAGPGCHLQCVRAEGPPSVAAPGGEVFQGGGRRPGALEAPGRQRGGHRLTARRCQRVHGPASGGWSVEGAGTGQSSQAGHLRPALHCQRALPGARRPSSLAGQL